MTTRTPTTHHDAHPHLRVLDGGLTAAARQEDELAELLDATSLAAEMAAAARFCDELEQDGLRITFDEDPAGGRIRAYVTDAAGQIAQDLSLSNVVSPNHLRVLGAQG